MFYNCPLKWQWLCTKKKGVLWTNNSFCLKFFWPQSLADITLTLPIFFEKRYGEKWGILKSRKKLWAVFQVTYRKSKWQAQLTPWSNISIWGTNFQSMALQWILHHLISAPLSLQIWCRISISKTAFDTINSLSNTQRLYLSIVISFL